jgi:nicotinamidase-related amidase
MTASDFHPSQTALVLIDLQHSNVARTLAPYPSGQVVANAAQLARAMRRAGGTVVHVRVLVNELLSLPADRPIVRDPSVALPPDASDLVPELGVEDGDVLVEKRQWGAFHGTQLDQQLRRRGIGTIVLAGIATNFGVESTARAAFDQGYALVFAEDAMSTVNADMHRFATQTTFPIMGRVRSTAQLPEQLQEPLAAGGFKPSSAAPPSAG